MYDIIACAMIHTIRLWDHIENKQYYDESAEVIYNKNSIEITVKSDPFTFLWKLYEKGVVVQSHSSVRVLLTLKEDAVTRGHIETEFGRIPLECCLFLYKIEKDYVEIKYEIRQGNHSQLFHFSMEIEGGHLCQLKWN